MLPETKKENMIYRCSLIFIDKKTLSTKPNTKSTGS